MQKRSLVLIICGIVVIIAVLLLIFYIIKGNNFASKDIIKSSIYVVEPVIEVSIEPDDITSGTVTINVGSNNSTEIKSITLPNGQSVSSSNAMYEVTKNGQYEFSILTSNGNTINKKINVNNITEISSKSPYIPNGFTHVDGTEVETGYVIKDSLGNEFVWVPVPTGLLIRNTDDNEQYDEIDITATGLCNSVYKHYGFYIARYEASKKEINGEIVAASEYGVIPWANVKYEDAYKAAQNATSLYGYTGVKTAISNSYTWDTTLSWINESIANYSSNTSYGNYSGTIFKTGTTEMDNVNSICDLAGNLREWTTEVFYPEIVENMEEKSNKNEDENKLSVTYRVIRGGSANINKVANSHIGNPETMQDAYWGFRMILYKD